MTLTSFHPCPNWDQRNKKLVIIKYWTSCTFVCSVTKNPLTCDWSQRTKPFFFHRNKTTFLLWLPFIHWMECNCCVMLSIMHQDKKLPHAVHLPCNQEWILITTFLCSVQQRPSSDYLEETEEDKLVEVFVLKHCAGVFSRPLVFYASVDPQLCKCFTLLHVLHLQPKPLRCPKPNQQRSGTSLSGTLFGVIEDQHIQSTSFNLCHLKHFKQGYLSIHLLAGFICKRICVVRCCSDCLNCILTLNKCDSSDIWEVFHALKCLDCTTSASSSLPETRC